MDNRASLSYDEGLSEDGLSKLQEEIQFWSRPHILRFFAQPFSLPDDKLDIMRWSIGFPGVFGTAWENGYFRAFLKFSKDFPKEAPDCRFGEAPFHPNIGTDGSFSSPFFTLAWSPQFRIETIINIVRDFMHTPTFTRVMQPAPLIAYLRGPYVFYRCARRDAELRAYHCVMSPF